MKNLTINMINYLYNEYRWMDESTKGVILGLVALFAPVLFVLI